MTSTLKTNAIEPEGATTNLVIGESGQNTVISNNDIRANVLQDAGGNAVFTSNGSGVLSGVNSGFGSAMVLLSTQTASNATSVSITSGITSTYGEYIFRFYNIHPATDSTEFSFQVNGAGESGFNETITSTQFRTYHPESGGVGGEVKVSYDASRDQAEGTAYQELSAEVGSGNDESLAGELHLFNPSNTTYAKHFIWRGTACYSGNANYANWTAGYINTTTAIDEISFMFASGNVESGTIKMWGVK